MKSICLFVPDGLLGKEIIFHIFSIWLFVQPPRRSLKGKSFPCSFILFSHLCWAPLYARYAEGQGAKWPEEREERKDYIKMTEHSVGNEYSGEEPAPHCNLESITNLLVSLKDSKRKTDPSGMFCGMDRVAKVLLKKPGSGKEARARRHQGTREQSHQPLLTPLPTQTTLVLLFSRTSGRNSNPKGRTSKPGKKKKKTI